VRTEAYLFSGTAGFFAATASVYGWFSDDPAGTAALIVSFLMSSLIAFFLFTQYRRRGRRPQDRREAEMAEGAGPLEFFPPGSPWPVTAAAGFTLASLGVVYGLWLFLIGIGLLAPAVFGFVFQYVGRQD
jgi:hypothetical protein